MNEKKIDGVIVMLERSALTWQIHAITHCCNYVFSVFMVYM